MSSLPKVSDDTFEEEVLNSEATSYGGSGPDNAGALSSEAIASDSFSNSIVAENTAATGPDISNSGGGSVSSSDQEGFFTDHQSEIFVVLLNRFAAHCKITVAFIILVFAIVFI